MDWDSIWVDPLTDPLVQLAQLLDLSLSELPNYLLALRLEDEIAGTAPADGAHARTFREGEAIYARLIAAAAPGMTRAEATRIARDALSAHGRLCRPRPRSGPRGSHPRPRRSSVLRAALVTDARRGAAVRCGDAAEPNRPPDRFGTWRHRVEVTGTSHHPKESIMRPVSRVAMAAALTLSAVSMLAHNLYELPLSPIDLENAGPIVFAVNPGRGLCPPSRLQGRRGGGARLGRPEPRDRRDRHRVAAADPAVRARAVGHALRRPTSSTPSGRSPWCVLGFRAAARPMGGRRPADAPWMRDTGSRHASDPWPCASSGEGPPAVLWHSLFVDERSWSTRRGWARPRPTPGDHHRAGPRGELRSRASILPRRLCRGCSRGACGARDPGAGGLDRQRLGRPRRCRVRGDLARRCRSWSRSGRRSRPMAGPSDSCSG